MRLSDAIAKIQAALSAVTKWDGKPDEELRHALLVGFRAAHELTAPEGTTSPKAQPRRDRLDDHRVVAMMIGSAVRL